MVMESLGPSLENLLSFCGKRFTVKTACMVAIDLINRMETMHQNHYIHRDIKPENFLIGTGRNQTLLYSIDFVLAKRYINPCTGEHNASKKHANMIGTIRYCSMNASKGWE